MDIFDEEVMDAAEKLGSNWIKGAEFDGDGVELQMSKPAEKVASRYGAVEGDYLVEQNLLKEGETFRFYFTDKEGAERKFDSKSSPFFIGIKSCEGLQVGDWVKIQRTGKGDKTRYTVTKVEKPLPTVQIEEAGEVGF